MERRLVLLLMLPAAVVLALAVPLPVLAVFPLLVMLCAFVLTTLGAAFIGLSGSDKLGINNENRSLTVRKLWQGGTIAKSVGRDS
jgi:hypothetical protein